VIAPASDLIVIPTLWLVKPGTRSHGKGSVAATACTAIVGGAYSRRTEVLVCTELHCS
jgi:hypothetical protein